MIKRSFTVTEDSNDGYTEIDISLSDDTTVVHIAQGAEGLAVPRGKMFDDFLTALNEVNAQ